MGVVYHVRQLTAKIDRQVALKLIKADVSAFRGEGTQSEASLRFSNETLAASRLTHDHIVSVFEVGEWRGRPYYTMLLVEGTSLGRLLREGPLSNDRAARILEPVARAVGHAHLGQILHRDLKPPNILLDAQEKPYVTDFGLAKLLESDESLTRTGQILGSVSYMSPEQASDPTRVREAGDIYSLGATLYEMLTGRPPFRASEPAETLRQAKYDLPAPPRRLNPAISRDLETICLKCLEKDPGRRYLTAFELADELARVLEGSPIRARPISMVGRTSRLVRKHPGVGSLVLGIFLVASLGFLFTSLQLRETRRVLAEVNRRSYYDQIDLADQALSASMFALVDQYLGQTTESLREWEYDYLNRLGSAKGALSTTPASPIPVQEGGLYGVAFHPQGTWYATGGRLAPLTIWDPGGRQPPRVLPEIASGAYVDDVQWIQGPRVNHLAAGTRDGRIHLWDEAGGQFSGYRTATHHKGSVSHLSFHPKGTELATAGEDGRVLIVDVATGARKQTIRSRGSAVRSIAYHPNGEWVAFAGDDREVALRDTTGRGRLWPLGSMRETIGAVCFRQDGRYLATGDSGGTIQIWDLETSRPLPPLNGSFDGINGLAFTPDGSRLASAGSDGLVKIWDYLAGREVLQLKGHTDQVDSLSFRGDGLQLLSVDVDGRLMLWDATPWNRPLPPPPTDLRGHGMLIVSLAVSPDGDRLASAGLDEEILVWDVPRKTVSARLKGHSGRVNGLSFDSTGQWLASAGRDGTLRI